jgi:LL-diaminopimelate aminotransferase
MIQRNPVLDRIAKYPAEVLQQKKRALLAEGVEVFDFSLGDPIEPTDFGIISAFVESVPQVSQYPTIAGEPAFRQACCQWLSRRFDVTLDADSEVIPASGAKEAIFHLPLSFLDARSERRHVLFGLPAYPVYERGTLFAGGEPWPVALSAENGWLLEPWTLDPQKIAQTAIIWINYPHNPTGATAPRDYLQKLVAFCQEREILLCADECYVDMYFEPPTPLSLLQFAKRGVLTFHSLSKRSGMTGYRSGFIAGDGELIATLKRTRANFGVASTNMVQGAAIAAWKDDEHVEKRRAAFRQKRDVLRAFFDEIEMPYEPCSAGLYIWVRTPGDQDALGFAEKLAEHGIVVSPASFHGIDQPYIRLALVPSLQDCRRAVALWQRLIKEDKL